MKSELEGGQIPFLGEKTKSHVRGTKIEGK